MRFIKTQNEYFLNDHYFKIYLYTIFKNGNCVHVLNNFLKIKDYILIPSPIFFHSRVI